MASKVVKVYSGLFGQSFLESIIGEDVREICLRPKSDGASFEIDPNKISADENLERNQAKLVESCNSVLQKILGSLEATPL